MLESSGYSSEFFFYCLQPYLNAINQETSSVTVKHLSSRTINQIPLPLPPLPEQRAIVSKIEQLFSELDNGIANLNTAKQKLEVYRQAVLKKAFEGELTREWREQQTDLPSGEELLVQIQEERERYYEEQMAQWQEEVAKWEENGKVGKKPGKPRKLKDDFSLFNQEELYYIPKYWKFVLPQQLCSLQKYSIGIGPFGSNLKVSDYTDEGVPLVFVRNITRNSFDRNLKFISQEKFLDLIPHSVHPGDILVTKMGDPPGDVTIYPNGKPIGIITSDCLKFRPLEGFADNKFYKYYLESVFTKKQLGVITMGVAQKKISLTRFKTIFLPLLSYEEQRQIVQEIESRLSVCDKFLESIEASLKKAEALRQSILKKAFEGTLLTEAELEACRQEPDWEPAEALLARIQGKKV